MKYIIILLFLLVVLVVLAGCSKIISGNSEIQKCLASRKISYNQGKYCFDIQQDADIYIKHKNQLENHNFRIEYLESQIDQLKDYLGIKTPTTTGNFIVGEDKCLVEQKEVMIYWENSEVVVMKADSEFQKILPTTTQVLFWREPCQELKELIK